MSAQISTNFTKLFGISSPIATAPMAYATTPALVAAAIKAGGIGFLGAGNEPALKLAEAIDQARVNLSTELQPLVSVGFVGWVLDMFDKASDPRLKTVLDKQVSGVWFAFGNDLGKYVSRVREHNKDNGYTTRVLVNVNTVEEAKRAADEWKADVIILQGSEAGGRGSIYSPSSFDFLRQVVKDIPNAPPILVAGGITDGNQVAEALTEGASGVVLGTRVLFTPECMLSNEIKQAMIEAGPNSTSRSVAYDLMFPPNAWPEGIQARCINNGILSDFDAILSPAERKEKISKGDKDHLILYAGEGVSKVDKIEPTEIVIKAIHAEAAAALKAIDDLKACLS